MNMAKKKASSAPAGVKFTSEIMRHTNKQTFSGASNVAMAEAISTPGYSERGMSGCFIRGAMWSPGFGAPCRQFIQPTFSPQLNAWLGSISD